jgi:hypothetical protein
MTWFDDAFEELRDVERYQSTKRRAQAVAAEITPGRLARLNYEAERWQHLTADATMAVARQPMPLTEQTFDLLGEISARRWLRDHPAGINYGQRMVTPAMRAQAQREAKARRGVNGPAIGGYPHGWSTNQFTRTQVGGGGRLAPEEIEARVAEFEANQRQPVSESITRSESEVAENVAKYREQLAHQGEVQYSPNRPPTPDAGGGLGEGLIRGAQALTDSTPTFSQQRMQTGGPAEGLQADIIRHAAMAADVPTQEFQGQVRNLYGITHGRSVNWTQPQSDLLIALGTDYESGEGFLVDPESEVAKERRKREAERGQIHGHNVTLGRWVADTTPFATDSKPWMMVSGLVDLGVQIADPTAFGLGKAGKGLKAHKLFASPELYEKAGLWSGLRRSIAGPDAFHFLDSKDGAKAIEWLGSTNDTYAVWRGLNRKVNFDLARRLADTRSGGEARTILEKELGTSIREVSTVKNVGFGNDPLTGARLGVTSTARKGRPLDMPSRGRIDAHDKDIVGREIEAALFNAGADEGTVGKHIDRVARSGDHLELNAAIKDTMTETGGLLERAGIQNEGLRSAVTRLHSDVTEEGSRTWHDSVAAQRQTDDGVIVGDEPMWDASANLYLEHAPRWMTLGDQRAVRRLVSHHPTLMGKDPIKALMVNPKTGQARWPQATLEAIQNEIWKPVTLITRIAWPIRVIGEEQIRMATAGYDSMFNHPISFIAGIMGKKGATDIKGDFLSEAAEMKAATVRGHGDWVDRAITTGHKTTYSKSIHERDRYVRSLGAEITKLANDPISTRIAQTESLDDVKEWFATGAGNRFRSVIAKEHRKWNLGQREMSDAYIESVSRRIRQHTGGNEELLEAVRTGRFRGENIMDESTPTKSFMDGVDELADEYGPDKIVGDEIIKRGEGGGLQGVVQRWNRTTDRMFGLLMSERTNTLSRSPTFHQAYWKEAERLAGFASGEARASIIRQARAAGIDDSAIGRMERLTHEGQLNLDEVDILAKGHGLDTTKELLYDLSKRGRTMDALRVVFPFGEAWREVATRWFHPRQGLLWQNPKSIRRFQQLVQGARGEEFGDFMGAPEGEGFFWQNQWGEEVFIWPGSQLLTDKLLGVPIPLTGRKQGLSMFGTVMPGLGPVAQIPVGWFLQNKPGPEAWKEFMSDALAVELPIVGTVQEQVLPFGSVGAADQSDVSDVLSYLPPWMKAAAQVAWKGDFDTKQWNQTVMEIAGSLKAEGGYGDTVEEQNRLYDDAQYKARRFYFIKMLAASTLPAAPDGEWMIETNNGKLLRAAALTDELNKLREEDFDTADSRFLDKYGSDLMAVISTPQSTATMYEVPTTRNGVAWVMANPGVEDKLPNVYGFFAPEGGDEDFSLYNDNFRRGEAIRLEPKNWIRLLNHTKGNVEYARYTEEVGDQAGTEAGRAYLKMRREEILDEFPGWRDERGKLNKAPSDTLIRELERAVTLPETRNTGAGRGLALYLRARAEVAGFAESEGLAWPSKSKALLPGRLYLDQRAQEIIAQHPEFQRVYDFVLSRETEELEEAEEEAARG